MSGKFLGRFTLSAIIIVWALLNILPIEDTPFPEFIKELPANQNAEFQNLINNSQTLVDSGDAPSLYVAISDTLRKERIDFAQFFPELNVADIKNLDERNNALLRHLHQSSLGQIKLGLDLKGGVAFTLKVDEEALAGKEEFQQQQQLSKAIDIMGRRVNGLGVAEPVIRARDNDAIEVQLPGISTQENPDVLASLQKPAKLTFHLVHRTLTPGSVAPGQEPIGYMPMNLDVPDPDTGEIRQIPFFVKRIPEMSGSMISSASPVINQFGGFEVALNLTDAGSKRFTQITRNIVDINKSPQFSQLPDGHPSKMGKLAVVLDNRLYSAPRVHQVISGGRAQITGQFSRREALELSNVLNNPLEFELKLEEMYEVGPTLAQDARSASINAALLGAALVIAFMALYYMSAGLVAVTSVVANLVIVLGVLASLGSTLTLPGVAALVLTIGMAVDANILIFERIREELRAGKDLKFALKAGFEKAFSTIIDANITTFLTAIILIWLGTGPVKGFGVTLAIGIGATLFCTLILNRALLDFLVGKGIIKKTLSKSLLKQPSFDFHSVRKPAFAISWIIVIAGLAFVSVKGDKIFGIDFLGGDEVSLKYAQPVPTQDIYALAETQQLGEVLPTYQLLIGNEDHPEILKIQSELGRGQDIVSALQAQFPDAQLEVLGINTIGASVSASIKSNALLAISMALLGILLYVALRFEFGFGIGAIVSTVHDVLMTIGIYVILGGQFSAPMVAAILMIVGYSINDTIVVFDRIREELLLNPTIKLRDTINLAINRTLSRTLLTSLTTLLAALALYIFGAGVVNDFALVFIIGILTGTFSSIFIAAPVFYWWHKGDRAHVEAKEFTPKYEWESGDAS